MNHNDKAKRAVVTVGGGRGFVVQGSGFRGRMVITAAHCLPHIPPALSFSRSYEKTYSALLAPLGEEPAIAAECLFVDPVADIAVLGSPDNQELFDEAEAYEALTESTAVLWIADAAKQGPANLLSLDGRWFPCVVRHFGGPLWISEAAESIRGGMSGSPIIDEAGGAIGVLCCSSVTASQQHREGGPNPRLVDNLPGWLLRDVTAKTAKANKAKAG